VTREHARTPCGERRQAWLKFTCGKSERFEARLSLAEVLKAPRDALRGPLWLAGGKAV
jgi:hypothetical protein